MPIFTKQLPLCLYIHLPWCVRKCPYCDFNSHEAKHELPEKAYVAALLADLEAQLPKIGTRPVETIFFGGGTPSLFSGSGIASILQGVNERLNLTHDAEITLEANPGTIDANHFALYREAGINRLSIGIQSLQDDKLKSLGRIHNAHDAMRAIEIAKASGFTNFNIDIMFGLPNQTIDDALHDIKCALSFAPTHFSWYQLTIEPNTLFHHQPPILPHDDLLWDMQLAGQHELAKHHFTQYEVSAYARDEKLCKHNLNYWQFGDYLGIGAGSHSKITDITRGEVIRFAQTRHPKDYLDINKRKTICNVIDSKSLTFEFMLNALRLTNGFAKSLFAERTGISYDNIHAITQTAIQRGLLQDDGNYLKPTDKGKQFLNNLISLFLPT